MSLSNSLIFMKFFLVEILIITCEIEQSVNRNSFAKKILVDFPELTLSLK